MTHPTHQRPVLITGASGGIGEALVESLLALGWRNLVCHYHTRPNSLPALLAAGLLDPAGRLVSADLTNEAQVEAMQQAVRARVGPLYGLVNLAGATSNALSWKMTKAQFEHIIGANLVTTFLASRAFIPEMRDQNHGRIINISSVAAHIGVAGASHYCAAKAGILGFTKSIAAELAPKQICVSAISLGYFDYGMIHSIPGNLQESIRDGIPARKFGQIGPLAALIAFLLSDEGAYSGGQIYHLNGGLYS
jgi:3-oxoacyl-[acyl-carrier protein] reductase